MNAINTVNPSPSLPFAKGKGQARIEQVSIWLLMVFIAIVLISQTRSLYIFPQPDGARWWGDETGQMLELRAELKDGFAHIPTGLGSSVAITNGLVRGNSWLAAAIYGIPTLLFSGVTDLVTIGRTITLLLSLVLCFVMYRMLRAFDVSPTIALFAVLLLVTTRSFFFASHAARLDVAAGLSVLGFVWYLSDRFERMKRAEWTPTSSWFFLYGATAILFSTLSIHLLTLLGLLSIYMLSRFGAVRKPRYILSASAGAIVMLAVLLIIYKLSGAPFTVFGLNPINTASSNQFQNVARSLPIERPLARSVQIANVLERLQGLWSEATIFLIVLLICGILFLIIQRKSRVNNRDSFFFGAVVIILIAWLFFQSPALYYYIHVLPLFIVAIAIGISSRDKNNRMLLLILTACAIPMALLSISDTLVAGNVSRTIERDNHAAMNAALSTVRSDSNRTVLAQNPAIAFLERQRDIHLMTAHLISFPLTIAPIAETLHDLNVRSILLYAPGDGSVYSEDYQKLRPVADSIGTIVLKQTGTLFDVYRDYFKRDIRYPDTLILYKLPNIIAR